MIIIKTIEVIVIVAYVIGLVCFLIEVKHAEVHEDG